MKDLILWGDLDSLACYAGYSETLRDMEAMLDREIKQMMYDTGARRLFGFCEHPEKKYNYRRQLATTIPYKSTRGDKPHLTNQAKGHLNQKYGIEFVINREAEDEVCIRANEYGADYSIIAGVDKDLFGNPFTFYNYQKHTLFKVTPVEAWYNYCLSMLMGDKCDDIKALSGVRGDAGIGKATAQKLLASVTTSIDEMTQVVATQYALQGREWRYMQEMAKLLRIQMKDDERWLFPVSEEDYYALMGTLDVVPHYKAKYGSIIGF